MGLGVGEGRRLRRWGGRVMGKRETRVKGAIVCVVGLDMIPFAERFEGNKTSRARFVHVQKPASGRTPFQNTVQLNSRQCLSQCR